MSVSAPPSLTGSFTPELFAAHLATVSHLPAWWLERKRAAYEKFATLPLPTRTDESWRFATLTGLKLDGYALPAPASPDQLGHAPIGIAKAGKLVLANNRLVAQESIAAELARKREWLVPALQAKGCEVLQAQMPPENTGGITTFALPGANMAALHGKLTEAGIVTSLRSSRDGRQWLRLSPHYYNTDAELHRVLELLG